MSKIIKFRAWDLEAKKMSITEVLLGDPNVEFEGYSRDLNSGDDLVVMQYTGINDKDDREIYEGDILLDGKIVVAAEWDSTNARWYSVPGTNHGWRDCQVIGNIYQNPELLT